MAKRKATTTVLSVDSSDLRQKYLADLGEVVMASALLDKVMRQAFCVLIGSEYATVVAAGRDTVQMADDCQALVKVHRGIDRQSKDDFVQLLGHCKEANGRRKRLVHDVWAYTSEETVIQFMSKFRDYKEVPRNVDVEDVKSAADQLKTCVRDLTSMIEKHFGRGAFLVEAKLRMSPPNL